MKIKLITFLLLFCQSYFLYAKSAPTSESHLAAFDSIQNMMFYKSNDASRSFDILLDKLSLADKELYKPYINYTESFLAFHQCQFNLSLLKADSALEAFLYLQDDEWTAQSLLLIGLSAESSGLYSEAMDFYSRALDYTSDIPTLGLIYLSRAREKVRLKQEWEEDYLRGKDMLMNSSKKEHRLYCQTIKFLFYPEMYPVKELFSIAEQYKELGIHAHEITIYRLVSEYYIKEKSLPKALTYIEQAIDMSEQYNLNDMGRAACYMVSAEIHNMLGERSKMFLDYEKAIEQHKILNCEQRNYDIYYYLFQLKKSNLDYESATHYLEGGLACYQVLASSKAERDIIIDRLFRKIYVIEKEILKQKQKLKLIFIVIITFIVFLFLFIIRRLFLRKRNAESLSSLLEKDKRLLKEETGNLLLKIKQKEKRQVLMTHISEVEKKIDKYVTLDTPLSLESNSSYAQAILVFNQELKQLTDTEKQYSAMMAIGISQADIAQIMSVASETVKRRRNRIRKKLNIDDPNIKLRTYLSEIIEKTE